MHNDKTFVYNVLESIFGNGTSYVSHHLARYWYDPASDLAWNYGTITITEQFDCNTNTKFDIVTTPTHIYTDKIYGGIPL